MRLERAACRLSPKLLACRMAYMAICSIRFRHNARHLYDPTTRLTVDAHCATVHHSSTLPDFGEKLAFGRMRLLAVQTRKATPKQQGASLGLSCPTGQAPSAAKVWLCAVSACQAASKCRSIPRGSFPCCCECSRIEHLQVPVQHLDSAGSLVFEATSWTSLDGRYQRVEGTFSCCRKPPRSVDGGVEHELSVCSSRERKYR